MAYSIEAAIQTGLFEKVIVSTDSEKYADIARFWAELMRRTESLSNDKATTFGVIQDLLNCIQADF